MNILGQEDMSPSTLGVFRCGSLLACIAVGIQQFVPLWFLGPQSLPFLHLPMISLVMQFTGGTIAADRMNGIFALAMLLYPLALAMFAAAFWRRTNPSLELPVPINAGLLSAQILLGLLINAELLYIVAAEFALVLARRQALTWLCVQAIVYVALQLSRLLYIHAVPLICNVSGADIAVMTAGQWAAAIWLHIVMGLAFQAMAFGVGYLAAAERRRRIKIAAAHAQLLATRHLLADAVSAAERVRIARELHDAIGHQLTAMHLHLDLARRQSDGQAAESLQASHELAQRLLTEVRKVVSAERA